MTMISKHLLKEQKKIYTTKKSTLILKAWKCHPSLTSRNVCYRTPRLVKGMNAQLGKNGSEWHSDWKRSFSHCGEINVYANGLSPPWLPAEQTGRVIENTHLLSVIHLSRWQPVTAIKWSPSQSTHARHSPSTSHLRRPTGSCETTPEEIILYWAPVKSGGKIRVWERKHLRVIENRGNGWE